jgi:hypothetical protein
MQRHFLLVAWATLGSVCAAMSAQANFVFGCIEGGLVAPRVQMRLIGPAGGTVGAFDSDSDDAWVLGSHIQKAFADGQLRVEYMGIDRRILYGETSQSISLQFNDLFPPSKAAARHVAGRADSVPVGADGIVISWTGTATLFTLSGMVGDDVGSSPCRWFCDLEIKWVEVAIEAPSFGRVKALYSNP